MYIFSGGFYTPTQLVGAWVGGIYSPVSPRVIGEIFRLPIFLSLLYIPLGELSEISKNKKRFNLIIIVYISPVNR